MLVVIDVGNTNITIGIYHGDKLIGNYRLTTKMKRTSDEYGFMMMNFLNASKVQPEDIQDVIVSSVVPKIMHSFLNGIRKYMHKEPIIIGPGIRTGISVKAENPKAVGADRIVDAAGAYYEYGGPCLVVDYGTATTFDYVDGNGNFEYGVITLGIETGAQAMWTQAAKLPEIEIKKPASILAKTTTTSMQAGLVYGYIGQSEYIIKEFKKSGCFQCTVNTFLDMCNVRKLAFAGITTGKISDLRFHQLIAECFCGSQIFLCDRIFIHSGIHCRTDHLWTICGKKGRRQHIVRKTMHDLGDYICGCRHDDEDIRTAGDGNMFDTAICHLFKSGHHHIVLC